MFGNQSLRQSGGPRRYDDYYYSYGYRHDLGKHLFHVPLFFRPVPPPGNASGGVFGFTLHVTAITIRLPVPCQEKNPAPERPPKGRGRYRGTSSGISSSSSAEGCGAASEPGRKKLFSPSPPAGAVSAGSVPSR